MVCRQQERYPPQVQGSPDTDVLTNDERENACAFSIGVCGLAFCAVVWQRGGKGSAAARPSGGGIAIKGSRSFIMNGGTISGNRAGGEFWFYGAQQDGWPEGNPYSWGN